MWTFLWALIFATSANDPREVCRFATSFDWSGLATNTSLQDHYLASMLSWDGKFGTSSAGTTNYFLTRDSVDVDSNGNMRQRASCNTPDAAIQKTS